MQALATPPGEMVSPTQTTAVTRSFSMANSVNHVQLIGRTGREPEMRYTSNGQPVTTFSLATDRRTSKREEGAGPDWHRVVAFGTLAEFSNQYLAKGRLVYVAGRLSYRSWTGQDGQQRHSTEIVASDVVLLDRRPSGEIPDAGDAELNSGDDQAF
jgi:single-strand DNA-binding protein